MHDPIGWRIEPAVISPSEITAHKPLFEKLDWEEDREYLEGRSARSSLVANAQRFRAWTDVIIDRAHSAARSWGIECGEVHEPFMLLRYEPGDLVDWHYDLGSGDNRTRKITALVLLSERSEYEGGRFEIFPNFIPQWDAIGSLLIFPSYLPHRLTQVTAGLRTVGVLCLHGPTWR